MVEAAVVLDKTQREIVNKVVRDHCEVRDWSLHAVNCHAVVSAGDYDGELVCSQLKSWGKRKLKEHQRELPSFEGDTRENWWTRKGSVRRVFDEKSLEAAIIYTIKAQEIGGSKAN